MNTIYWFWNWVWKPGRRFKSAVTIYFIVAFCTFGWRYNVYPSDNPLGNGEAVIAAYMWPLYIPGKIAIWLFS